MRIGLIAPPWVPVPPPAYGGIEAVVDELARGLVAAGHEVLLHAPAESRCPVPRTTVATPARDVHGGQGSAVELDHVVVGYEAMLAWGPDVVHDHTLLGPTYGGSLGMPVVTTNHGPFADELVACYRAIAEMVPVVAISHDQASMAGTVPIAAVIHHGIDIDAIPTGPGDGGYALFLGRMSPDKGVDAAARIARDAGVPLRIASRLSEPAEHDYFNHSVKPLLGDGVDFVGEVGGESKCELIRGASCLLNPIAWPEPFGMVMIEALARSTPVVATPCGSVPELIDDGVTGFVRSSPDELADALHQVPTLDRARCRATAAERFSTGRMVADHLVLYEQILAGLNPRRVA